MTVGHGRYDIISLGSTKGCSLLGTDQEPPEMGNKSTFAPPVVMPLENPVRERVVRSRRAYESTSIFGGNCGLAEKHPSFNAGCPVPTATSPKGTGRPIVGVRTSVLQTP